MAKLAGKQFRAKVSTTTGGVYSTVVGMDSCTMNLSGTLLDASEFVDTYMERLQGLKDVSFDLKGKYNSADTTGQNVIMSAFLNDTALFIQYMPDGVAGFKAQVSISKFSIDAAVNGIVGVTITGEIAAGTLTQF